MILLSPVAESPTITNTVCQGIAETECQNLIFYSHDELARQVHARIRISEFSFNGLKADE